MPIALTCPVFVSFISWATELTYFIPPPHPILLISFTLSLAAFILFCFAPSAHILGRRKSMWFQVCHLPVLHNLLSLSELHFFIHNNNIPSYMVIEKAKGDRAGKCLAKCLAHSKSSINVSHYSYYLAFLRWPKARPFFKSLFVWLDTFMDCIDRILSRAA